MNKTKQILSNVYRKRKQFMKITDKQLSELRPMLMSLANDITGNHEDAEDVVQTAMSKAVSSESTFKGKSKLSTWLYSIVKNESLNFVKKRDRMKNVELTNDQVAAEGELDQDKLAEVEGFLMTMSQEEKDTLVMMLLMGLTVREVSFVLNRSVGFVSQISNRAMDRLRDLVTKNSL